MAGSKRKAAQILRKAAALIDKVGWHQGSYENYGTGQLCALGAINTTAAGRPSKDYSVELNHELAMKAMKRVIGRRIPDWNDEVGRSREEVTAAMRRTARLLEHGLQVGE